MRTPNDVAVDNTGNVYFSDRFNNCIRKIDVTGTITTIAGNGSQGYIGDGGPATAAEFFGVSCMTFDVHGDLYISDIFNNRIRKINTVGIISTIAGIGMGAFIEVDSGDGGPATNASLGGPSGLAFDKAGNLFFTEYYTHNIRKINSMGIITTIAGNDTAGYRGDGGAATTAEFYNPTDIAIDPVGNLDITDAHNGRLRQINIDGQINTIAGTGINGFSGDGGDATLAEFDGPVSVAVDPSGSIYISDLGNSRIRYIRNTVAVKTVDQLQDNLSVYPNPSDGEFRIMVSSKTPSPLSIAIIDELGRTIRQIPAITNETITVKENIPPGTYFVCVKDETNAVKMTRLLIR